MTISGTAGNDALPGTPGDDTFVYTFEGNDTITDAGGNDVLELFTRNADGDRQLANMYRDGDDLIIEGVNGQRLLVEGAFSGQTRLETVFYRAADGRWDDLDDSLFQALLLVDGQSVPSGANTLIVGTGADDILRAVGEAGAFSDLFGHVGNDTLIGGDTQDYMYGWQGDDSLTGGSADDLLDGGEGNDTLNGGSGNDSLYGGPGNDTIIQGGSGTQVYDGGDGIDTFITDTSVFSNLTVPAGFVASVNLQTGFSGALSNPNGPNNDTVAGIENVTIRGDWDWVLVGDAGNNRLSTQTGDDTLEGGRGNDFLSGGHGSDDLDGDAGRDRMNGGAGSDDMDGGGGRDLVRGGGGSDDMEGGSGNDRLIGGGGNDVLDGEAGRDVLIGGGGRDTFVFSGGSDTVRDFSGRDRIDLDDADGIDGFQDLIDNHARQVQSTVVIRDDDGDVMRLLNVDLADLTSGDFLF
jgi:Ca2+-binding RTX toxin-like protein